MFEEKKREWKKDSPKTTMLWHHQTGVKFEQLEKSGSPISPFL
jgi:hypothetical protein